MKPVTIDNPILNSPFDVPARHHKFDEDGITDEVVEGRRHSHYFIPIATPKKKKRAQKTPSFIDTVDQFHENDLVNTIREMIDDWRAKGYPHVTPITRALLDHWRDADRHRQLFFCQLESLETLIYLTEAAKTSRREHILKDLENRRVDSGTRLRRLACKMATGTGKTVVMGMVIAWNVLNKRRYPKDKRFSDLFLVVAPGITIRDRLRVLLPSDPQNYYRALDLVPVEHRAELGGAKVVITNYHAFKPKEFGDAGKLTKQILAGDNPSAFTETPAQMTRRVCREFGTQRGIVVLNDEAHHCYRPKPPEDSKDKKDRKDKLTGRDRTEAKQREEEARVWLSGLEAVHKQLGIRAVYDLSATPFYLRGSGYAEGTLFPWVVSDFSLIDAIESGIVKIPRVPIEDNSMTGDQPTYRDLWLRIKDDLPKGTRDVGEDAGPPGIPGPLEGALRSLYAHYEQQHRDWAADKEALAAGSTPPVFIVVCNNTIVSKMVFDWIAGREIGQPHPDGSPRVAPGNLKLFDNVEGNRWRARPNTILVDSKEFEAEGGLSNDFKKLSASQIDEFKAEFRERFPGRDVGKLSDQDLMREVLNTVGKAGKLGEHVRCVVSVSMLTEGWDANTVTHILGVRAFSTQLLCEQVVGRGLRRVSYTLNDQGHFDPEYADVYGVPFQFLPCSGTTATAHREGQPKPGFVKAIPERLADRPWLEITYPRVTAYRYELPPAKLEARFADKSRFVLTTEHVPTETESAPIVGESATHSLDGLKDIREQRVAFEVAKLVLERYAGENNSHAWAFPQILAIVKRWMSECVECTDDTFPQLLMLVQNANRAAEKVFDGIVSSESGEPRVRAVLQTFDTLGSTRLVSFDSRKELFRTDEHKCHVNFVVADSGWESKAAQSLESMREVRAYVKNQALGFKIPYQHDGRPGRYYPDFILRIDDGRGEDDLLNLVVEVTGRDKPDKDAKVSAAENLWVPAVNAEESFGRWAFLEITDRNRVKSALRDFLRGQAAP